MNNIYCYFIQEGINGNIKIGVTKSIKSRLITLQTANSEKLRLLGYVVGNKEKESELHRLFIEYRVQGEFFKVNQELIDYINENNLIQENYLEIQENKLMIYKKMKI
jgi:hypothetical protein